MEEFNGIWAVVKVAGGQYIGKIRVPVKGVEALITEATTQDVLHEIDESGRIFMKPAYEFTMMMHQTQAGVSRVPMGVPVSLCLRDVGTYLWPTNITFFKDMEKEDSDAHKKVVEETRKSITASRTQAAGLVAATADQMPGFKIPGGPMGRA